MSLQLLLGKRRSYHLWSQSRFGQPRAPWGRAFSKSSDLRSSRDCRRINPPHLSLRGVQRRGNLVAVSKETRLQLIGVNYFPRRVASPGNVTANSALGVGSNQRQFRHRIDSRRQLIVTPVGRLFGRGVMAPCEATRRGGLRRSRVIFTPGVAPVPHNTSASGNLLPDIQSRLRSRDGAAPGSAPAPAATTCGGLR